MVLIPADYKRSKGFLFASLVLNRLAETFDVYFNFPHELIRSILYRYYLIETHIDIRDIVGTERNILFKNLWKFALLKHDPKGFINPHFFLDDAKNELVSLNDSKFKTYSGTYKGVPLLIDIYNPTGFIDKSDYDRLHEEGSFQHVVDTLRNARDIPRYIVKTQKSSNLSYYLFYPREGDLVLVIKDFKVRASGIVQPESVYTRYGWKMVKITKSYKINYKPNDVFDFTYRNLAVWSKTENDFIHCGDEKY